jgi:hypothetical protein
MLAPDLKRAVQTEILELDRSAGGGATPVISLADPAMRGVAKSARELFEETWELSNGLDEGSAGRVVDLLLNAGCEILVVQGFPSTYPELIKELKKASPGVVICLVWHGNFLQMSEDADWDALRQMEEMYHAGLINKVGFVKRGMAELFLQRGVKAWPLVNFVPATATCASTPPPGGPYLGVWNVLPKNWRKQSFAMLAASAMVPGAQVRMAGASPRVREFADYLGLAYEASAQPVPEAQMPATLEAMHINLHVTLSECSPMLPLESLAVGTPCLIGPNSRYFEESPYLHSRLVVPQPDDSSVILDHLDRALAERAEIITEYLDYVDQLGTRSRELVRSFLAA